MVKTIYKVLDKRGLFCYYNIGERGLKMENLQSILDKFTKEYEGLTYSIKYSQTTSSIYIRFYHNGVKRTARISDHPTGRLIASCGIDATTERFLRNQVKALYKRNLWELFKKIENKGIEL